MKKKQEKNVPNDVGSRNVIDGSPGGTRTHDLGIKSPLL